MMWIRFMDMRSGGGAKLPPHEYIYLEAASIDEAKLVFFNRFGRNPDCVTCTCCGEDYWVSKADTLAEASAHDRECKYVKDEDAYDLETAILSLEEYKTREDVLVVCAEEISPNERIGELPQQGYVWLDE